MPNLNSKLNTHERFITYEISIFLYFRVKLHQRHPFNDRQDDIVGCLILNHPAFRHSPVYPAPAAAPWNTTMTKKDKSTEGNGNCKYHYAT